MSEHTPTPWRVAREAECPDPWVIAVGEGDSIGEFSPPGPWISEATCTANARRAIACVNAFHDPAGRKIATEDIAEGLFWKLIDHLLMLHKDTAWQITGDLFKELGMEKEADFWSEEEPDS